MPRWPGQYYNTTLDRMIDHLAQAEAALAELTKLPIEPTRPGQHAMSVGAYKATRKRAVIQQLRDAIRHRVAWHASEIAKAEALGFSATESHEPKRRSNANPRSPAIA
jgi:hypothetical protein